MSKQKIIWTTLRILTFLIVGIFNTLLIRTEDIGTWKNYLGYLLLLLAVADTILLVIRLIKSKK